MWVIRIDLLHELVGNTRHLLREKRRHKDHDHIPPLEEEKGLAPP
jgi:hypothetical protein